MSRRPEALRPHLSVSLPLLSPVLCIAVITGARQRRSIQANRIIFCETELLSATYERDYWRDPAHTSRRIRHCMQLCLYGTVPSVDGRHAECRVPSPPPCVLTQRTPHCPDRRTTSHSRHI